MKKWFIEHRQYLIGSVITIVTLLLLGLIVFLVKISWRDFKTWFNSEHGSVADWVSGLGTIAAFGAVIWQQHRQEKAERAFKIEQSRPRFTIMYRGEMPASASILTNKNDDENIYKIVNDKTEKIVTIENISRNTIYELEAIITYKSEDEHKEYWIQNGIPKGGIIALVPSFLYKDISSSINTRFSNKSKIEKDPDKDDNVTSGGDESNNPTPSKPDSKNSSSPKPSSENHISIDPIQETLIVKFTTSSNETGYYLHDFNTKNDNYYYVKDKRNKLIQPPKSGKMVQKGNQKIKDWEKELKSRKRKTFTVPYSLLKKQFGNN